MDEPEDVGRTSDGERLRAIEEHLRAISRWMTWFGVLSVVAVLVVVINWLTAVTA